MAHQSKMEELAGLMLAPVHFLEGVLKLACMILILPFFLLVLLWNHELSWRLGFGDHGYYHRSEQVQDLLQGRDVHQLAYQIDFTHRSPDFVWEDNTGSRHYGLPSDGTSYYKSPSDYPASLKIHSEGRFPDGFEPNPCEWEFTSTGGYSWDDMPHYWLNRKGTRWQRDLFVSAVYTGALRRALTQARLGWNLEEPTDITQVCSADLFPVGYTSRDMFDLWKEASEAIVLPDAPIVSVYQYQGVVLGVSRVGSNLDVLAEVTPRNDIDNEQEPFFSSKSVDTENYLLDTSGEDFWIQEAHRNGIFGKEKEILQTRQKASEIVSTIMEFSDKSSKDLQTYSRSRTKPLF